MSPLIEEKELQVDRKKYKNLKILRKRSNIINNKTISC